MKPETIVGTYREDGAWRDSRGASGKVDGLLTVALADNRIVFSYEDGTNSVSENITASSHRFPISGTLGDGYLMLAEDSLILEYDANVQGHMESNTDIWFVSDESVHRAGLIRQEDRIIWFEITMHKINQP